MEPILEVVSPRLGSDEGILKKSRETFRLLCDRTCMLTLGVFVACLEIVPGVRLLPHTHPHPLDARAGDLLAVVQLQALQATAVLQVL